MSAAYDALIASPAPQAVVLAEVQPMEVLGTWTKEGGLTNVYSCSFASFIATAVVPGGLYRRLDVVRQNATALTSRASAALVDANLGSYFFDSSASKLYVSTTTGSTPENFALLGAWFTLFFSSSQVSFTDQPLYEPRVASALPTLTAEKPDPLFGVTITDQGTLALANTDAVFDKLSQLYIWRNKTVTFKLGGFYPQGATLTALAYSDYTTIGTMRINSARVDDELFTLQLETMSGLLNKALVSKTWGDGTLAIYTTNQEALGLGQPVLIGAAVDVEPIFLGSTLGQEAYGLIDQFRNITVQAPVVTAINRTTGAVTVLTHGVDYSDASGWGFTMAPATIYTNADYFIRATIYEGSSVFTTGGTTFGNAALRLLELAGELAANIKTADFTALDAAYPAIQLGLYVTDGSVQAAEALRTLEQSVLGQVYVGLDGLWTIRIWDPSVPSSVVSLSDADFATWDDGEDLASALTEVRVSRVSSYAAQAVSQSTSSADLTQYANETFDSASIASALMTDDQTSILANRLRFLRSRPPNLVECTMRGLSLMTASVGDLVSVTRARGPIGRTGRLDGQLFMIQRLEKHLGDANGVPSVTVTLNDLEGQTDYFFRLAPSGYTDTWDTASAADKAIYGFLADANGYIDATDPTTKTAKVLW